jgi:UDP-glucose 4-epimerase
MAALPRIGPSFKNPIEVIDVNVNGTANVLEYARKNGTSVIYAGSSSFHGGVYKNPYTFTKWQGEELCKMYSNIFGVTTSICRFYNVYGDYMINEGAYRTVLSIFKEQYEKGKPLTITGDGEQRRDFTHVDDIVDGMIRVMRAMNGEVDMFYHGAEFELGRGKNYSINEIADMFGEDYPKEYIPSRLGEYDKTLCEDRKAHKLLGWTPVVDLEDYLSEVVFK